jgi:hypothetical protein
MENFPKIKHLLTENIAITEVGKNYCDLDMVIYPEVKSRFGLRCSYTEEECAAFVYLFLFNEPHTDPQSEDLILTFESNELLTLTEIMDRLGPIIITSLPEVIHIDAQDFIKTTFNAICEIKGYPKVEEGNHLIHFDYLSESQKASFTQAANIDEIKALFSRAVDSGGSNGGNSIFMNLLCNPKTPAALLTDCITFNKRCKISNNDLCLKRLLLHANMNNRVMFQTVGILIKEDQLEQLNIHTLRAMFSSPHFEEDTIDIVVSYSQKHSHITGVKKLVELFSSCPNASTQVLEYVIRTSKLQDNALEKPLRAHLNLSQEQLAILNVRFPNVVLEDLSQKNQKEICLRYLKSLSENEVFNIFRTVI